MNTERLTAEDVFNKLLELKNSGINLKEVSVWYENSDGSIFHELDTFKEYVTEDKELVFTEKEEEGW